MRLLAYPSGKQKIRTALVCLPGWSADYPLVPVLDCLGLDAAMDVFESAGPDTGTYRRYIGGIPRRLAAPSWKQQGPAGFVRRGFLARDVFARSA